VEAEAVAIDAARVHRTSGALVVERSWARARVEGPELCFETEARTHERDAIRHDVLRTERDERCVRLAPERLEHVSSLLETPTSGPFR
ncbi:MAG: hypothetical protein M3Y87_28100, partial [Myxococcota bacterium]|nr:hypothetical protein [Myxococcota bacterium]